MSDPTARAVAPPPLPEFLAEARSFLDSHLPRARRGEFRWGEGTDQVGLISQRGADEQDAELAEAREWRQLLYDNGFGWLTGPARYGGRELPDEYEHAWQRLLGEYEVPSQGPFFGLGMVAPTFLRYASEEVCRRLLPAMFRGDIIACQMFSEPGAGSDLAAISTLATRAGDSWRVNGQKIWSSGAHYADIGEIICRTDSEKARHQGLTAFIIDMRQDGVQTRPIREATGKASFSEVFLDDAVVRDGDMLGEVGQGWEVAMATMRHEREAISRGGGGAGNSPSGGVSLARLASTAQRFRPGDPHVSDALMEVYLRRRVGEAYRDWPRTREVGDYPDGADMAIAKLLQTRTLEETSRFLRLALDERLWLDTGEWGTAAWADYVLDVEAMKIAGGSTEIMKNIVAERVLGLPR